MPKKHPASINLLKRSQNDFFERFIDWALTAGRLLVILTEVIALSSFIYRFTLDRQIIDLHSKIKQEEAAIELLKDKEETYVNLQERLKLASQYSTKQTYKIDLLEEILSYAPTGSNFDEINISEGSINIAATFQNASSLRTFINSLRGSKAISSVSLDKIENKLSSARIIVGISAVLSQTNETKN